MTALSRQRIAKLMALDDARTSKLTPGKWQGCRDWKWMRPGLLDSTDRRYIYEGAGEYGKHYHASANTDADAAFIAGAPEAYAQLRAALERIDEVEALMKNLSSQVDRMQERDRECNRFGGND